MVFRSFADNGSLPIQQTSIEKQVPPKSDILCKIAGEGEVAFELVQIVDPVIAKIASDTCVHRREFEKAYNQLSGPESAKFKELYRNALLCFSFHPKVSLRKRNRAITDAVKYLLSIPPSFEGEVALPSCVRNAIKKIHIYRGEFIGPIFDDTNAYSFCEPACECVKAKFEKKYDPSVPIELLAYYTIQPILPYDHWLPRLERTIQERLPSSPFRRVWVFDFSRKETMFVFPGG